MSTASAHSLRAFLEQPARPADTLTYHELQGFLFAVVSAPELVRPSEWLPAIFNDHDPGYATLEEANTVLEQIMTLYNDINAAVMEQRAILPADCLVHPTALDNLEDSAPLARWSRGFLLGHDWLEELWNVELPDDLEEELGAVLMALSFFSSRNLAEAFHRESAGRTGPFEGLAESMLRVFPEALAQYAHLGRSVLGAAGDAAPQMQTPRQTSKVGRNDPCSSGSRKKSKRRSGQTRH